MNKNMGTLDRVIRVIAAIVIGYLYFNGTITGNFGILMVFVAILLLMTSLIRFCPLYLPFGIYTCKPSERDSIEE